LLFRLVCLASALVVPALVLLLAALLMRSSIPAMQRFGLHFFISADWNPTTRQYGALTFIYGTLVTSAIAMLLAVPLSVGAAAFLSEIASGTVRRVATFLIELLAAIPSVVYGFWGIFFLVPVLGPVYSWLGVEETSGFGIMTAAVILAIMIVPYIAAITFDVCQAVPRSQREGALALGSTRWQMIWRVVLPYARPGIIGACFLALGRALGETMAVAMLIGNRVDFSWSPFQLGATIPSVIANKLPGATYDLDKSALIQLGLVLFLVTVVVNVLARLMIWQVAAGGAGGLFAWLRRRRPAPAPPTEEPTSNHVVPPAPPAPGERLTASRAAAPVNALMTWVLGGCLLVILLPLFHILCYITIEGVHWVRPSFFTNLPGNLRDPGLGHSLLGSLLLVATASAWAIPVGILAAVYLAEYRRSRVGPMVRFVGELLGGVPSIVLGIFAYTLLVIPFGFSGYAGAFALGVMMIPIVMRSAEESMRLVPASLRNASYALGATQWQTVTRVVLPSAMPAIITGVFLAIARIAGETAPLLFTANNSQLWPRFGPGGVVFLAGLAAVTAGLVLLAAVRDRGARAVGMVGLLGGLAALLVGGWMVLSPAMSRRVPFLTYYIYHYSQSEEPEEKRLAWAGALVLLAFVMLLNVGIRLVTGKRAVAATRGE
jgi:phosphate transport system permease protein